MQTSFNILLIFLTIENFGCDEKFSYSCETFCTRDTVPINFFSFACSSAGSYRIEVSVSRSFFGCVNDFVLYCKATDNI